MMSENLIFKDSFVTLNVSPFQSRPIDSGATFFSQDLETGKKYISLVKDGQKLPLSMAAKIEIDLQLGNLTTTIRDVVVEDSVNGLISFIVPSGLLLFVGKVTAGVLISYSNGQGMDCGYFTFHIARSLRDKGLPTLIEGPQGIQGNQGETGPQGPRGERGEQGIQGEFSKQAKNHAKLLGKLAKQQSIRIVCQGDSMTYGQDTKSSDKRPAMSDPTLDQSVIRTDTQASVTYPEKLQACCDKIYGGGVTVINRGYSGDHAEASYKRWTTNPNADLTFLMLGTNDAAGTGWVPSDIVGNLERYMSDMSLLIEQLLDWGSAVVLLTIPKHALNSEVIFEAYREALIALGVKYNIPVVDSTDFLTGYPYLDVHEGGVSGWHYSGKGNGIFGAKVAGLFAGIGKIYNPYTIRNNQAIIPTIDEYGLISNNKFTMDSASQSPLGVGSLANNGKFFYFTKGGSLTMHFVAEEDNLVITPLFSLYDTNAGIQFELDFGVDMAEFTSPYVFDVYSRGNIPQSAKTNPTLSYSITTTIMERINVLGESKEEALENSFHLPGKGNYSIKISNPSDANGVYFLGFLVRRYNEIDRTSSGNALTATALQNPRTINGVSFDGTADITVTAQPSYVSIPAGVDLDAYRTHGYYHCASNANAQNIANTPVNIAFSLQVIYNGANNGVTQIFQTYQVLAGGMARYIRGYELQVGWGPWTKIITQMELDATLASINTANKTLLQTNGELEARIKALEALMK